LHEFHDSPIGGHAGVARISTQFFWPRMYKDVKRHVQHCLTCQKAKSSTVLPQGLLQLLPIPAQIWEDVTIDFIVELPPSQGCTVIMVVIDRLSKYVHLATEN